MLTTTFPTRTPAVPRALADALTPEELGKIINIQISTLAKWRSEGHGPAHLKVGRRVMYPADAVQSWLDRQLRAKSQRGSK
jgi:hypothetical protein